MSLVAVTNIRLSYGTRRILNDVTLSIEPGERIGLVGRNGTGKTTLMRVIAGQIEADDGSVQVNRGARIGYLAQDPEFGSDMTVFEAAESAFAELHETHSELDRVAHEMENATGETLDRLMRRYESLEHEMQRLGGYAIDHRIEETLHGLGFQDDRFTQNVNGLSGGERSRLALARLLLEEPDLLLLDEPTNHLDIDGRRWLESFLIETYPGAVLVVSHDRYLLDRVPSRIIETEADGSISSYPGNYEKYRKLRYERRLTMQREFEKQMDHVRREQQYIRRYKAGQRAKQAAGRESRLDRFRDQIVEKPIELDTMRLTLPKAERTGDIVINAEDIAKSFGERTLFNDVNMIVNRGDRVGIIGPNGAGKTTFVRCLIAEGPPDAGQVRVGANVSLGYYSQVEEGIDLDQTVWQFLQGVIKSVDGGVRASEQQARDLAGAFLFSGDDQEKQLDLLSGGERSRARIAGLVASGSNLLVLDEPTNHFDIPSTERLEQALDPETGFNGTVIIISHDRAFLDGCVNRLLILDGQGGVQHFPGNYADWQYHLKEQAKALADKSGTGGNAGSARRSSTKSKNAQSKRASSSSSSSSDTVGALSKWNMKKLETRIEEIETRVKDIDQEFLDPAIQRNGKKVAALTNERETLLAELEPLEFEWSRRAEEETA